MSYTHGINVETRPGETEHVVVGGSGQTVIGRIENPKNAPKFRWGNLHIKPVNPPPKMPVGFRDWTIERRENWRKEWAKSKEAAVFELRASRHYSFVINEDNTFRIPDLPADDYTIHISINAVLENKADPISIQLGILNEEFSLKANKNPAGPMPYDLGTLKMKLRNLLKKGDVAPPINFTSLDGQPMSLEDFRGRVVLLDFWATWCGPCIKQMPDFEALHKKYKGKGFVIVAVSIDEDSKTVEEYLKKNPHPWTQTHIPKDEAASVSEAYSVFGVPSLHLIGADGKIIRSNLPIESVDAILGEHFPEDE